MTPERLKQVERTFQEALDRDPGLREAFLDAACAGDGELRREVASLFAAHRTERSPLAGAEPIGPVPAAPRAGGHHALAPGGELPEFLERPLEEVTAKLGIAWPLRSGAGSR